MRRWCTALTLALTVTALAPTAAQAQDTNYWTEQFGNRAQLLGGAVIGSDNNLSATFYNPGRIPLMGTPEVIVTGNIFELETVKVLETRPPNRELSQTRFRLVPSLIAGELLGDWLGDNRLAYTFLTKTDSRLRVESRLGDATIPGLDPEAQLAVQTRVDSVLTEYWAGVTWARTITPRVGIGLSTFVTVRNQRSRLEDIRQGVEGEIGGIALRSRDYDYYHWGVLWKLGVSTDLEGWQVGATVTTPRVRVLGSGKVGIDDSRVVSGGEAVIRTNFQEDLSSTLKTPWSVGIGGSRRFDSGWEAHLGVEWFSGVPFYTILDAEPADFGGEQREIDLTSEMGSIVNVAIGGERRFSDKFQAFGSFRSDFSARVPESEATTSVTGWDLWHLAGGASFLVGTTDLTLGLVYSFGKSSSLTSTTALTEFEVDYSRLTLILGFDLPTGRVSQPSPLRR